MKVNDRFFWKTNTSHKHSKCLILADYKYKYGQFHNQVCFEKVDNKNL